MFAYAVRRILLAVPTAFLALTTVFLIMHVAPGDPTAVILGPDARADARERLRKELDLDRPILESYFAYLTDISRADLGNSLVNRESVVHLILSNLPYTIDLAILGMFMSWAIGIPLGIVSALHRNRLIDYMSRVFALVGLSVPGFILGLLLLIIFALRLRWFPIQGAGDLYLPLSRLHHLFLPGLSLGLFLAAFTTRLTRASLLDVLQEDYIRTARAKGLKERTVLYQHALRNALLPVATISGIYLAHTLGGVVLLEAVFSRPGIGSLLAQAITSRDFPVIQGTIVCFSLTLVLVNMLVDLSYTIIDPRVRFQ